MPGRPQRGGRVSGRRVTFIGNAMAAVVQGVEEVRTLIGHSPVVVGGLAVMCEFLEEYRWEPADIQPSLLQDEPLPVGDERWDALLAALADHLAAQHDLAAPQWAEIRVLQRPWFPAELEVQRADALVWAPAAFRKHGVYLSARDLEAA
jgi:hypothetical protein